MSAAAPGDGRIGGIGGGLCDSCSHQQVVRNTRGSAFSLCLRSRTDPQYPRYPRIPVLACPGYEPGVHERADTESAQ